MAWFLSQSLMIIIATFVLGLIVGWLWWGRQWRRVPLTESAAVQTVARRLETMIADRDTEIARLRSGDDRNDPGHSGDTTRSGTDDHTDDINDTDDRSGGSGADAGTAGSGERSDAGSRAGEGGENGPGGPSTGRSGVGEHAEELPSGPDTPVDSDDLERIEGIGPRIATALRAAGITTYHVLAQADEEQLRDALREARLTFAPSLVTWSRQAALLAGGDEAAFQALTSELVGRRRPHRTPAVGIPRHPEDRGTDTGDTGSGDTGTGDTGTGDPGSEHTGSGDTGGTDTGVPAAALRSVAGDDATGESDATDRSDATGGDDTPRAGRGPAGTAPDPGAGSGARSGADSDDTDEEEDLERVEGIGPRISTALNRAGIRTYRQLAAADIPTLQEALETSGLRFAPSLPTWSRQAALLADGDEDGFLALTDTLVAGRDTGRKA